MKHPSVDEAVSLLRGATLVADATATDQMLNGHISVRFDPVVSDFDDAQGILLDVLGESFDHIEEMSGEIDSTMTLLVGLSTSEHSA